MYLARDISNKKLYAMKACDKAKIRMEHMQMSIFREKSIMLLLTEKPSPFFVKLWCTFQGSDSLCKQLH